MPLVVLRGLMPTESLLLPAPVLLVQGCLFVTVMAMAMAMMMLVVVAVLCMVTATTGVRSAQWTLMEALQPAGVGGAEVGTHAMRLPGWPCSCCTSAVRAACLHLLAHRACAPCLALIIIRSGSCVALQLRLRM